MKLTHNSETIDIQTSLPVIPLRDVVVFPHMIYPLLIGRNFTINALQHAMNKEKQALLVAQKQADTDNPEFDELFEVGIVARILQVMKMPNGTFKVLVEGLVRAKVNKMKKVSGHFQADISVVAPDKKKSDRETEALSRTVSERFSEYVKLNRRIPEEVLVSLTSITDHHHRSDSIADHILHKIEIKQQILEAF